MLRQKVVASLVVLCGLIYAVYVYARLTDLARMNADLAVFNTETVRRADAQLEEHDRLGKEIDALKKTIYGPQSIPARQPSFVEVWQVERDKELRKRIQALEEWRLRQDR